MGAAATLLSLSVQAQTIRAVMHADIKIIDPIWTSAYNVEETTATWSTTRCWPWTKSSPCSSQMLEGWKISDDKLTYTFNLRDGLVFHDGAPVTSADCIAFAAALGAQGEASPQMRRRAGLGRRG